MKKETLYIIGAGVLAFGIGYYLTKPKQTEEKSSFAGTTTNLCLSKEQMGCLSSNNSKGQIAEVLRKCGLNTTQISNYFTNMNKLLSSYCK